jgi:hypothetical protein
MHVTVSANAYTWKATPLLLGSVLAVGSWWLAARWILGEYRPELVGARYRSDLEHPVAWIVQAGLVLVGLGALAAALLVFHRRSETANRRIVAAVVALLAVGLALRSGLTASDERCAFDTYGGYTTECVSGPTGFLTDVLMIGVPSAVVIGSLLAGTRRGLRRSGTSSVLPESAVALWQ